MTFSQINRPDGINSALTTSRLLDFQRRQLERWPLAAANFAALAHVRTRELPVGGVLFRLQHNPARMRSTGAKVDKVSVAARPCFLCASNRPAEQIEFPAGMGYDVLVNPFPIFPVHFTVPAKEHVPQQICAGNMERFADMLRLAAALPGLALFYNGATCGASAPDHFHFQIVEAPQLPVFGWVSRSPEVVPFRVETTVVSNVEHGVAWFSEICHRLMAFDVNARADEPGMNVLCTAVAGGAAGQGVRVVVIPRRAHRPDFYGTGDGEVLLSPASVDLSGVMVAPSADDFEHKINSALLDNLLDQTCFKR